MRLVLKVIKVTYFPTKLLCPQESSIFLNLQSNLSLRSIKVSPFLQNFGMVIHAKVLAYLYLNLFQERDSSPRPSKSSFFPSKL